MNPLFILGIVAGAFFLGRKAAAAPAYEAKRLGPPPGAPIPTPTPDAPLPLPEGATGNFDAEWAALPYGVEIYPPNATTDFPPPPPGELIASPGCEVIAVSDTWWNVVGDFYQERVTKGATEALSIYKSVVAEFLPNCKGKDTPAHRLLAEEVLERIQALLPRKWISPPIKNPGRRRGFLKALRGTPSRRRRRR